MLYSAVSCLYDVNNMMRKYKMLCLAVNGEDCSWILWRTVMIVSDHFLFQSTRGVLHKAQCWSGSILSVESNQNVESKMKNVESKIAFGQLILRKIIKTVATRCQILRLKCTKIHNSAGVPPQTPLGSLQRSPDLLPGFKGPTSKGRGGEWRGWDARWRDGRRVDCCGV